MSLSVEHWGQTPDGVDVSLFTFESEHLKLQLTNLGAAIVALHVPDRNGVSANINLRHAEVQEGRRTPSSFGAICGRYANRIGRGRFSLDGQDYQLATNSGPNHLHGGRKGFSSWVWDAEPQTDHVTFRIVSPDGDEGYPGALSVAVTYRLSGAQLTIDYAATTTAPTVLNLTNHAYWNLGGTDSGTVYDTQLQLHADHYLEADENVLATGVVSPVEGTAFDFRTPHSIGSRIQDTGNGYDHCYVINGWDGSLRPAARAVHPASGRVMEVSTTEPGVQLYTSNHFNGSAGTAFAPRHGAFCLECQHYPDSPNQPKFPSTVLRPEGEYTQRTVHRFSVDS